MGVGCYCDDFGLAGFGLRRAAMTPKVLIYVDDGRIDIRHTPGVEVAVIVEGEDVEVPDDWVGLLAKQHHSVPITVNREELPPKQARQCPETQLAGPNVPEHHQNSPMRAPYCFDCGDNHPPGPCPSWEDAPEPP